MNGSDMRKVQTQNFFNTPSPQKKKFLTFPSKGFSKIFNTPSPPSPKLKWEVGGGGGMHAMEIDPSGSLPSKNNFDNRSQKFPKAIIKTF